MLIIRIYTALSETVIENNSKESIVTQQRLALSKLGYKAKLNRLYIDVNIEYEYIEKTEKTCTKLEPTHSSNCLQNRGKISNL